MNIMRDTPADDECRFLEYEAASAKNAMTQSLRDMKATVVSAVDIRAEVSRHPLIAVGSALAAGFATGAWLAPSKDEDNGLYQKSDPDREEIRREARGHPSESSMAYSIVKTILASVLSMAIQRLMVRTDRSGESRETQSGDSSCN